jgi:hypothetical protein
VTNIDQLAVDLQRCLDAADVDAALLALVERPLDLDVLEASREPHPVMDVLPCFTWPAISLRKSMPGWRPPR